MRKPTKLTLRTHLTWNGITPKTPSKYVIIDGGALLYKVQWLRNSSYHDLANQYVKYLKTKHKKSIICVVSDGYNDHLSTKVHEHLRRGAISSADMSQIYQCKSPVQENSFREILTRLVDQNSSAEVYRNWY